MHIFIGELIGTMLLVLLGDGVVANVLLKRSKGENSGWIVISTGWGFAVTIAVYAIGWSTGGHVNPAVTLGFTLLGKTSWNLVPYYICGQMIGAMIGALLVWLCYYPHFEATENKTHKLLVFSTEPAIRKPFWNFVTELIGTAVLLIGVLGIFDTHNGMSDALGPIAVGILIFSIGLSLGGETGYAINPARDLGPRIMHALLPIKGKGTSDWGYAWIPVFGPLVGGMLGAFLYKFVISHLLPLSGLTM